MRLVKINWPARTSAPAFRFETLYLGPGIYRSKLNVIQLIQTRGAREASGAFAGSSM